MTKKELFDSYEIVKHDATSIVLKIHMPSGETEIIANPNVAEKIDYINRTYDDNLQYSSNKDIYIENFTFLTIYDEENNNIGDAIDEIKDESHYAYRKGWFDDKYLIYVPSQSIKASNGITEINSFVMAKYIDGRTEIYVPTQDDLLAEDWAIEEMR